MSAQRESEAAGSDINPLEEFRGAFPRSKTGFVYQLGLVIVAFAMVLLPLLYLALIGVTVWAVLFHLQHDMWIMDGSSGRMTFYKLILYLSPAVVGGILVFFMVKPFLAKTEKSPELITLDPKQEPLLFAFVERICALVGAPKPCRIDVDSQVNASASLRRGLWSRDLVLTIGLPLVAGMHMRQLAGVLAHEFGHFAQGAGMRLTYVIRRINHWFARVVYERDSWDQHLESGASDSDWRLAIVLQAARGCVWLTRRILWGLMQAGHMISCFMMRQMEYDADSYQAKLAGSDNFESTFSRLRVLGVGTQSAYEDVRQCWTNHRLPENFPLLIAHKSESLPAEVHQKISEAASQEKTGWLDTHPCHADRTRAVERLKLPGVFHVSLPASRLFSNFEAICQRVTRHHYEKDCGLEFTDKDLMPADEMLKESATSAEADAMISQFYGEVVVSLLPLAPLPHSDTISDFMEAKEKWRQAKKELSEVREHAEKESLECLRLQNRLIGLTTAQALVEACFLLTPEQFGLPDSAMTLDEQSAAATSALADFPASYADQLKKLEPFFTPLRQRVSLALRMAELESGILTPEEVAEAGELVRLVEPVAAELPQAQNLGAKLHAIDVLNSNRENHPTPAQVDDVVSKIMGEMQDTILSMRTRLQAYQYPFPHSLGAVSLADYLRYDGSAQSPHHGIYLNCQAHADRLFVFHYRLVGRLLALVHKVEMTLPD